MRTACATVVAASLVLAATASAAPVVLVNDGFNDGRFQNRTDPQTFTWQTSTGPGQPNLAVVDEPLFGGNALQLNNPSGFTFHQLGTNFGTQALAVGDSLSLSFNFRFISGPETTGGSNLRFGLGNSGNPSASYSMNVSTGTFTNWSIQRYTSESPNIPNLSGGGNVVLASGTDLPGVNNLDVRTLQLTVTRTGASEVSLVGGLDGVTRSAVQTSSPITSFSWITLQFGGTLVSPYQIDNVVLTYTPIPEPTGALAGIAGLALLAARRRRA